MVNEVLNLDLHVKIIRGGRLPTTAGNQQPQGFFFFLSLDSCGCQEQSAIEFVDLIRTAEFVFPPMLTFGERPHIKYESVRTFKLHALHNDV